MEHTRQQVLEGLEALINSLENDNLKHKTNEQEDK